MLFIRTGFACVVHAQLLQYAGGEVRVAVRDHAGLAVQPAATTAS